MTHFAIGAGLSAFGYQLSATNPCGFSTKSLPAERRLPRADCQPVALLRVAQGRQRLAKFLAIVAAHRELLPID